MKYDILHELPGRMRVHCRNLCINPENRIELNRWVSQHLQLVSASLSSRTGNLLIVYAENASRDSILVILGDLRLFGMAEIGNSADVRPGVAEITVNVITKQVCKQAVRSVLPRAALRFKAGWALGCALWQLGDHLANGRVVEFLFAAGKTLLFGLVASSLPLRIAAAVGISLAENRFPRLAPPQTQDAPEIAVPALPYSVAQAAV